MSKSCNTDTITSRNLQNVELSSGKSVCIPKHLVHNNVALNKVTKQSSSYVDYPTGHFAVDGHKPATGYEECSHSAHEPYPSLTVDLGDSFTIDWVSFYTRPDCCEFLYHDLQIRVGETTSWDDMTVCGMFNEPSEWGKTYGVQCPKCLVGRFVTFKIVENFAIDNVNNQLSLCEVSVFGI